MRKVKIGFGRVGRLERRGEWPWAPNGALMGSRLGVRPFFRRCGGANPRKARAARLAKSLVTSDWESWCAIRRSMW
ncbi:MAG: hypothetical protein CM1200mP29_17360 [Verrucomicrobiota bacterium]|nr:MAG: hypothetical protein CM1200mP29_17360 [Verrucomicrobiota bacterium]